MATGRIFLRHNFDGETGYVIIRWFKNTSPLTPASGLVNGSTVTQVVYPAPHTEQSLVITEIDAVMYTVRAYRSTDGVNPDEQINSVAVDASQSAINILSQIIYIVGRGETGDPYEGDTGIRDSRLLDKEYNIEERGTGTLVPETEWIDRSDDGGGFDFAQEGKVFYSGGVYVVTIQERQDIPTGTGFAGVFGDVVIVTEDTEYSIDEHAGKNVITSSTDPVLTFSISQLSTVGDSRVRIQHGGTQTNTVIQLYAGDTVFFRGSAVNKICLGKGEWIELLIKNNVMYVVAYQTAHNTLGMIRWLWAINDQPNTVIAAGAGPFELAEYPRVAEILSTTTTVSLAAWATDRGKWGLTGSQFRFPDLIGYFIRAVSSDVGRTEAEQVGPHTHPFYHGRNGGIDNNPNGGGIANNLLNPITENGYVLVNAGSENRPKNMGLVPHICI